MSSRLLNSRFNRTRSRRGKAATAEPQQAAAATAVADEKEAVPDEDAAPEVLNVRFGFATIHGKVAVIELSEEIWGNKRYYCAAFSEDPSICIKALDAKEALIGLIRHLKRSPTIRQYYFDKLEREATPRFRIAGLTLFKE